MTALELARRYEARAEAVPAAAREALVVAGNEAVAVGKQVMEEKIYGHPIPKTKAGKPKWVQTRNLIHHERVEVDQSAYTARLVNDMIYARRRHELSPPTTKWPAHWRDEAIARVKETFSLRVSRAFQSVWKER